MSKGGREGEREGKKKVRGGCLEGGKKDATATQHKQTSGGSWLGRGGARMGGARRGGWGLRAELTAN